MAISNIIKGFFCLSMVVILWISSGYIIQFIFNGDINYKKPLILTFVENSVACILFFPKIIRHLRGSLIPTDSISFMKLFIFCLPFSILWITAQYTYNWSLQNISYGVNSALSSSSSIWTYSLSILVLKYNPEWFAMICIAGAVSGVLLTAFFTPGVSMGFYGNTLAIILCISSSMIYAVFSVLLKKIQATVTTSSIECEQNYTPVLINVNDENNKTRGLITERIESHSEVVPESPTVSSIVEHDTMSFLGMMGIQVVLYTPLLVSFADITNWETFIVPSWTIIGLLLLTGLLGTVMPEYFLARAVIYLNPFIISVGECMSTPISIMIDTIFLKDTNYTWGSYVGSFVIFCSVVALCVDQYGPFKSKSKINPHNSSDVGEIPALVKNDLTIKG